MSTELRIIPVKGIGEIAPGTDLGLVIYAALQAQQLTLQQGDVLVITQKIVSKAEGEVINLDEIRASEFAQLVASQSKKDAPYIEVVLRESRRIVRMDHSVLISETKHGFICANAGLDESNAQPRNCVRVYSIFREKARLLTSRSLFRTPGDAHGAMARSTWR